MKLTQLTTYHASDGSKIARVSGCVADHDDPEKQKEWINFQFGIDLPTVRNGVRLRIEVLKKAKHILDQQEKDLQSILDQNG